MTGAERMALAVISPSAAIGSQPWAASMAAAKLKSMRTA